MMCTHTHSGALVSTSATVSLNRCTCWWRLLARYRHSQKRTAACVNGEVIVVPKGTFGVCVVYL